MQVVDPHGARALLARCRQAADKLATRCAGGYHLWRIRKRRHLFPMSEQPGRLEAADVRKRYGAVTALAGVSLVVEPGECVALVGESGSGKTTLLRCFNRLVMPDEGVIRIDGADTRGLDPVSLRRRIGYVQQDGGLLPHWRVGRNAALVPWLDGAANARALAASALERVGLSPALFVERWPAELSGGQRQRVAIARALAAGPGIVLFDEPFGALDAITRSELQDQFIALRRDATVTALLVTHDLDEAFRLADRVAVLRAGALEQVDTPAVLREQPATNYVEKLLERARIHA